VVGLGVDEGALDGGVQLLLCILVHLLDKLMAFVELVPFSMTLVASHGCTVTPVYPKKTKCKPICMPGSIFMHIVDISE
jgi:hypothetical protein